MEKNRFLKILCYGTYVVGFQTMVIMDLWGMAFHAMVVIGLIPALLFISIWACCVGIMYILLKPLKLTKNVTFTNLFVLKVAI